VTLRTLLSTTGLAALAAVMLAVPPEVRAESLSSLPEADELATLGAPETLPRTRKAQVIYPAPGLPAVLRAGQEIVARVRVRRAMTPPPGIPQRHVLVGWGARLVAPVPFSAEGTSGRLEFPLRVYQIRPEDDGFVYRFRLMTPATVPAGVYDLWFEGPGFTDRRPRSVRILGSELERLELSVVPTVQSLWREAEGLFLLDPAAVLVPGGTTEAEEPLSRWPLPTFSVPAPTDAVACRSLQLDPEVSEAVIDASGCREVTTPDGAACVVRALGGAGGLRPCGDERIAYGRRVGPTAYAVGLGDVTLVGLNTMDRPQAERAALRVRLGSRAPVHVPLSPATFAQGILGASQRAWIDRVVLFADELLLLGHHPLDPDGEPFDRHLLEVLSERQGFMVAAGEGSVEPPVVHGPATIELHPVPEAPIADELSQMWRFEPGRFRLGEASSRPPLQPVGTTQEAGADRITVAMRRPPTGRLRVQFLVPVGPAGWAVAARGSSRRVTLRSAAPADGDLCTVEQVLVRADVEPGPSVPVEISLVRDDERRPLGVSFSIPERSVIVGREVEFHAAVSSAEPQGDVVVFWDFGDQTTATGSIVRHRYIQSGPTHVCALAIDRQGRAASAVVDVDVARWGNSVLSSPRLVVGTGAGLIALSVLGLLLGALKGNILGSSRRLH